MKTLADVKAAAMDQPGFAEAYAQADAEARLYEGLIRARTAAGLTQAELAARMGTTQSAVARLEGGRVSPSLETLRKYAAATGRQLRVELVG